MSESKKKIIRTATIPLSLSTFLDGFIEPLMEKYELILVSSPDVELEELGQKYDIKIHGVQMYRRFSAFQDIKSLLKLISIFRKEHPYLVHSMTPKAGLLCMIAAWICRVPRRVHTFTGLLWPTSEGIKRRILMTTDRITCACATHVIPEGEGVKNDLQRYITKKPMRVLGFGNVRGVDMQYWRNSEAVKNHANKLRMQWGNVDKTMYYFLFVGRIVKDKGIEELVEAFERIEHYFQKSSQEICPRLIMVGNYEDNLDPISEITRKKITSNPNIIATGQKTGIELLAHYSACDCFVFPSYREGFPNTVLEAGAMELPCIVTDINGSREIIINGKNGVIIPPMNVQALYNAMKDMIENNVARIKMSQNARGMIETRFEQSFVRKCLFDFYDEIM